MRTFAILITLAALASCAEKKHVITGNLVSLPDGSVWLYEYDNSMKLSDSTYSYDGRFSMPQPGILPDIVFLRFESYPGFYLPVILDGGDVFISGNFNYKEDIKVTGTETNDALREYASSIRNYRVMIKAIDMELDGMLPDTLRGNVPAGYVPTLDEADSTAYAGLSAKRDSLRKLIRESRKNYVDENPGDLLSAMLVSISTNDSMSRHQMDSVFSRIDTATMKPNAFVRRMEERREKLAN